MVPSFIPDIIPNWTNGEQTLSTDGAVFEKLSPHSGEIIYAVTRSTAQEVNNAVTAAIRTKSLWQGYTPVQRGEMLYEVAKLMGKYREEIATVVALETGMSYKAAAAETRAAIAQGEFMAGEGRRFFGRTLSSTTPDKYVSTIRQPLGVAGLIVAANTPIANVAWKVFPALIAGNTAVLKAAEDAPATAWIFAWIAHQCRLPNGVLNVVQGYGADAGASLVADPNVDVVSFTGSTAVGRQIATVAGQRLAKVALELGGKNPLVVCDDADLDNAIKWALLSAFSNAGQRCAAASRIIVLDAVYDHFLDKLVQGARLLKVGPTDLDDYGPVINERQLKNILAVVERAQLQGADVLCGGHRLSGAAHAGGFYVAPTIIENAPPQSEISTTELFGPVTCVYRVKDFAEALLMANDSPYGLTAAIHTRSIHRATEFTHKVQAGVAVVNGGTHGSEPHMPFGGVKHSGNGWREPGTEALDVYTDLKNISINIDPHLL